MFDITHSQTTKVLDETKLKAFADDELNNKNYISAFDRGGNIVRKGENAGYQHFLLFPHCFQRASKCVVVWKWDNSTFPNPLTALLHGCKSCTILTVFPG